MSSAEEGEDIKSKIRDVVSTIVTADFFVVCGFLLWFLAGIFQSNVLGDDTIQIAFNSKFVCSFAVEEWREEVYDYNRFRLTQCRLLQKIISFLLSFLVICCR